MSELGVLTNEQRRLDQGPTIGEKPGGIGIVRFRVRCGETAPEVLRRAKSVLKVINEVSMAEWPSDEQWAILLPNWFVQRCARRQSEEDAEKWLAWWKALPLSEQTRVEREKSWMLDNWIYWLAPTRRKWYWWDGTCQGSDDLSVAVEVYDWPFAWGALNWLFRASGAREMNEMDEGGEREGQG